MAVRGITQQQIADHLGVHVQTVKNWMTGRTQCRLTLDEWESLAQLMGTKVEHLPRSFAPQPIHDTSPNHESN
ncbi:MAG: helix-turn-helix domain-containing protein [Aphanocapsa sp. GSE-SYN-MK-11-07L]|jgi:transcriptional regulator with XRE-family HTH domain|nr:helix-turn-helix domain-containing protein [Aphanocapsa sp. GSE-SYN-MK-11-07L]